ncbi:hypothetical protein [Streptomyces sp. P9-A4]|uniref:hypothetical protein n=1 Tax=Streptomyces sp. P9-A4 TaxID=3072285 RepID=UPI002FCAC680
MRPYTPGTAPAPLLPEVAGVAVPTGSARNSSAREPSHALGAIGPPPERVRGSVRISFGHFPTEADAARAPAAVAGRQLSRTA